MTQDLSTQLLIRDAGRDDIPALVALMNALNRSEGVAETMTQSHAETMLFAEARKVDTRCLVARYPSPRRGEVRRGASQATISQVSPPPDLPPPGGGELPLAFLLYYPGYDMASVSYGFHIADLYVAEAHRRQGIARALMRELATRCLSGGGQWCSLTVLQHNTQAQALYDALGFASLPVGFRCIGPTGLSALST